MGFFNEIDNNTIVDTLKQLRNRIDCKMFCASVPQTDKRREKRRDYELFFTSVLQVGTF